MFTCIIIVAAVYFLLANRQRDAVPLLIKVFAIGILADIYFAAWAFIMSAMFAAILEHILLMT